MKFDNKRLYILFFIMIVIISLLNFLPFSSTNKNEIEFYRADSMFITGLKFSDEKNYDKAILVFRDLIKEQPEYAFNHLYLGYTFEIIGEKDSALFYLKKGVEIDPEIYNGYYHIGEIYCDKGEFDIGIEYIRLCLELNPYFIQGYRFLSSILLKLGDIKGYEMALEKIKILEGKR